MISRFARGARLPPTFFDGARRQILDAQRADGAIAWFVGGLVDPWNHLEAAMGLNCLGERAAAERAFEFLFASQLADGSWHGQMGNALPIDEATEAFVRTPSDLPQIRDTNHIAYIATAALHHHLLHRDQKFLRRAWPVLVRAMEFVLAHQSPHGDIRWAADDKATPEDDALLSGCASIYKSLASALVLADEVGEGRTRTARWHAAWVQLGDALRTKPHRFDRGWESKAGFSMDWYYPILAGAVEGAAARARLAARWSRFVVEGAGCLCVAHEPWVTLAETAELVLALMRMGERAKAEQMLGWLHQWRNEDGTYYMGRQMRLNRFWPMELPPWTAGAVILATDAVLEFSPAHHFFSADLYPPQHAQRPHMVRLGK